MVQAHHTDSLFQESLVDYLYCKGSVPLLLTDNETNQPRIFGTAIRRPYVKDGINNCVVHGHRDAANAEINPRLRCKENRLYRKDAEL